MEPERNGSAERQGPWRFGPLRVDHHISVTGLLALVMAFVAMVGGWYKFDYRVTKTENAIELLESEHREEMAMRWEDANSRTDTNVLLGKIVQALEDRHIHIRSAGAGEAAK